MMDHTYNNNRDMFALQAASIQMSHLVGPKSQLGHDMSHLDTIVQGQY